MDAYLPTTPLCQFHRNGGTRHPVATVQATAQYRPRHGTGHSTVQATVQCRLQYSLPVQHGGAGQPLRKRERERERERPFRKRSWVLFLETLTLSHADAYVLSLISPAVSMAFSFAKSVFNKLSPSLPSRGSTDIGPPLCTADFFRTVNFRRGAFPPEACVKCARAAASKRAHVSIKYACRTFTGTSNCF